MSMEYLMSMDYSMSMDYFITVEKDDAVSAEVFFGRDIPIGNDGDR